MKRNPGFAPGWLARVDVAAWVVDASGEITFANSQAIELLGAQDVGAVGERCWTLVHGLDEMGKRCCTERCDTRRALVAGEPMQPFLVQRVEDGARDWLLLVPIPVADDAGDPHLVHLAFPMGRYRRIERYWRGVTQDCRGPSSSPQDVLSVREREILTLLGRGEDLKRIARELHISYATVRNHVQHILEKLRVHSMQEAVGLHLLLDEETAADRKDG